MFGNKEEIYKFMPSYTLKTLLVHPAFSEGEYWSIKDYAADQIVFEEGGKGKEMYVILSGVVSVCTNVEISENRRMRSGICELFESRSI